MILQALYEYYQRKDPNLMPPLGWEQRGFKYHVLIKTDGTFIRFESVAEKDENGRDIPKQFYVPSLGEKKGNGIKANLLWENPEYMFGIPVPSKAKPEPDVERVAMQHRAFCERVRSFAQTCRSPAIVAIVRFCDLDQSEQIRQDPLWPNIIRESPFLLITVEGQGFLFDIPEIRRAGTIRQDEINDGFCLVTNQSSKIARLEPPIKGVWGTDAKAERSLVSFNHDSFNSFGKDQNFNSPISSDVTLAYSSALNALLGNDSMNRLQIGDTSTIFWSEKATMLKKIIDPSLQCRQRTIQIEGSVRFAPRSNP